MRVGIVNSQEMEIQALRRTLAHEPQHQVVWVAKSGEEALDMCVDQRPQLLLLSLTLPGISGVETTQRIMRDTPCAILIVAATLDGESGRIFEAMGQGALDVVVMPTVGSPAGGDGALLLAKVDTVRKLIGEPRARPSVAAKHVACSERLVAVGASAGGPTAVATLLAALPVTFPAAIVVVQHVDEQFAAGVASWLRTQCAWPVRLAREGDQPTTGAVLLAGSGNHLVFKTADTLGYTPEPLEYPYRPSVDAFFQTVSRYWRGQAIGVLLTGMGRDGALGLKAMRDKGHHTIAQDRDSSAVYGMPKAAAKLEAAVDILPLRQIAMRLQTLVAETRGPAGRAL